MSSNYFLISINWAQQINILPLKLLKNAFPYIEMKFKIKYLEKKNIDKKWYFF